MVDYALTSGWFWPLVDILCTGVIVCRLFSMMRASTAIRILIVLPLLMAGSLLARLFGLVSISWLLNGFFGSLILLMVVVFQHDIRRALLSLGRPRPEAREEAGEHLEGESGEILDQLALAAVSLSERRNGALIVIEREMSLAQFMEVGTDVDAKVTSEIISSIFLPYSPIHDGAVIIQKGKLTKAGCFLPLTQNPDVAKELGTRHRAAIGLSEVADALVIVVSEETGAISVVSSGRITSNLDELQLKKLLRRSVESRWLQ